MRKKRAKEQLQKKLPVIMAPGGHGLYFDYAQSASDMEPINHGGNSPWWKAPFPGARIFYTVNNRPPGDADWEYTVPVTIPVPPQKKIVLKTIVITPAGRRSVVTKTVIENP